MSVSADYVPLWKLREIIGDTAAGKLIAARGGRKFRVPALPKATSPLAKDIGIEAARRLGAYFAVGTRQHIGCTIEIPRGPNREADDRAGRIARMVEDPTVTNADIIAEFGLCERSVRRWRARLSKGRGVKPGPQHPRMMELATDLTLSINEVAARLKVGRSTVERWRDKCIPNVASSRPQGRGTQASAWRADWRKKMEDAERSADTGP